MTTEQKTRVKQCICENLEISVDDLENIFNLDLAMAEDFAERRGVHITDDVTSDMILTHLASHFYIQRKGLNSSSRMETTELPRFLVEIMNDAQYDQFAKECGYE